MQAVEVARLLFATLTLGHGPELRDPAAGGELDEELILGWTTQWGGGVFRVGERAMARDAPDAAQKNGLLARSCSTVVNGPWPGQISVPGGNARICSRTLVFASSPCSFAPPIEPAKRASPTMAT